MPQPSPFTSALFDFFRELRQNNRKEWFEAHRERYEEAVLEPSRLFVRAFRPHLRAISPHFQAEPRVRGGSLFRIHNNRRFHPDRPPYKEHAGIQFRHLHGGDVHAPGFYLHLEPAADRGGGADRGQRGDADPRGGAGEGGPLVAMGLWRPDRDALTAIRDAIVDDPERWIAVRDDADFRASLGLSGASLKRGPVGFDRDHPLIDDIKRTDFIAEADLGEDEVVADGFVEAFAERCRAGAGFMAWLCEAVGVPF